MVNDENKGYTFVVNSAGYFRGAERYSESSKTCEAKIAREIHSPGKQRRLQRLSSSRGAESSQPGGDKGANFEQVGPETSSQYDGPSVTKSTSNIETDGYVWHAVGSA